MEGKQISSKGITLVGLLISIIILLILATISINFFVNEKILDSAIKGTEEYFYSEIKEQVKLAYNEWKINKETENSLQLKDIVEDKLNKSYGRENVNVIKQGKSILVKVMKAGKEYGYTLISDGSILKGQILYLDITDGNVDLYSNGYKQYKESLQEINKKNVIEYTGKYLITGTTSENVVRICDIGNYEIIIKNLNIDVSDKNSLIPFLAGNKNKGLNVTINIEGVNNLTSNNVSALSWSGIINEEGGSRLELIGNGTLNTTCGNSYGAMCIGGRNAKNITITSGNISAIKKGERYGQPIGGEGSTIVINRWQYSS